VAETDTILKNTRDVS